MQVWEVLICNNFTRDLHQSTPEESAPLPTDVLDHHYSLSSVSPVLLVGPWPIRDEDWTREGSLATPGAPFLVAGNGDNGGAGGGRNVPRSHTEFRVNLTEEPGVWTPGCLSAILPWRLLKNACHYHQRPTDQVGTRSSSEWFLNNKCLPFLLAPGQIPPLNLSDLALSGLLMSLSIHKPPFQGLCLQQRL